jgi:hypothetical protein
VLGVPLLFYIELKTVGGQLDQQSGIVGLHLSFVSRLVSYDGATSVTLVYDDVALFGIGLRPDRAENTSTVIRSVTGIYIHVQ